MIFAIAILGLNILTGFSGQISLGHGAFLAIGAFTTAIGVHTLAPALSGHDPAGRAGVRRPRLCDRARRRRDSKASTWAWPHSPGRGNPRSAEEADQPDGRGQGHQPAAGQLADPGPQRRSVLLSAVPGDRGRAVRAGREHSGRSHRASLAGGPRWRAGRGGIRRQRRLLQDPGLRAERRLRRAWPARCTGWRPPSSAPTRFRFNSRSGCWSAPWSAASARIVGAVFGGLLSEFLPIYAQQLLLPINKQLANAAPGAVQGVLLLVVLGVARGGLAGLLEQRRIGECSSRECRARAVRLPTRRYRQRQVRSRREYA